MPRFFRWVATIAITPVLMVILDPLVPAGTQPPWGYVILAGYVAMAWFITGIRGYVRQIIAKGSAGGWDEPFQQPGAGVGSGTARSKSYSAIPYQN